MKKLISLIMLSPISVFAAGDVVISGGGTGTVTIQSGGAGGSGDITDVNAGYGITVTNPTGPAPTVNLASDTTGYIQNRETLQSGATFYVSSGTVSGQLTANTLILGDLSSGPLISHAEETGNDIGPIIQSIVSNLTYSSFLRLYRLYYPDASTLFGSLTFNPTSAYSGFSILDSNNLVKASLNTSGRLALINASTTTAVGFQAPAGATGSAGTYWTLPNGDSSGFFKSNGSAVMSISALGSSDIPGGATSYIQLKESLQSGATFFVSSGTVNTQLRIASLNCTGNTNGGALTTTSNGTLTCSDDDSGSSGGYALEPATVTITASKGISVTTITFTGGSYKGFDTYSAGAGLCQNSNGCTSITQYQTSTSSMNYVAAIFPDGSTTYWDITVPLPFNYDASTFTYFITWTSTVASGDVQWNVQARAIRDGVAIDGSPGTVVTVTDTASGNETFQKTAESGAMTASGSPVGGDFLQLIVYRGGQAAADTMTADARFTRIQITYGKDNITPRD